MGMASVEFWARAVERQMARIEQGLAEANALMSHAPPGESDLEGWARWQAALTSQSDAGQDAGFLVYAARQVVTYATKHYLPSASCPPAVREAYEPLRSLQEIIVDMRDAIEHFDEKATGETHKKPLQVAEGTSTTFGGIGLSDAGRPEFCIAHLRLDLRQVTEACLRFAMVAEAHFPAWEPGQ
jgi:hypothetical protein